jgi:alpha-glucosidase
MMSWRATPCLPTAVPLLLCGLLLAAGNAPAQAGKAAVASPDGAIRAVFSLIPGADGAGGGQLSYEVTFRGKAIIERSLLGFEMQNQPPIGANLLTVAATNARIDETYRIPAGKSNSVRNQCNTLLFDLKEAKAPGRKLTLEARAYNDGIAFRYIIPDQPAVKEARIVNEKTEFVLASDATTYPLILRNFRSSWEDDYRTVALSGIAPESVIGLPLLTEIPGVAFVAITEADIDNYAGMYLAHSAQNPKALVARLAPRIDEPGLAVASQAPVTTPWRVLMISNEVGRLIESQIVNNLNPPCAIADTSWIKPGKASWDWWSGPAADGVNFKIGSNTETANYYIDFSAKAGFEYFMFDAGWAAHGTGPNDSGADITQPGPGVDLPAILAHAKSKNVKVWLWAHWTDVERQMDEAFPLFEKWGIAGVKIDFMDRDDQWMVNYYRRVAKKAAEHHLMIDFHGAYKPDGIGRTWPNVITREGVMGLEYNKWSARITPDHNVMLAFTRMLAGPMDYTPGGFRNATREEFEPAQPEAHGDGYARPSDRALRGLREPVHDGLRLSRRLRRPAGIAVPERGPRLLGRNAGAQREGRGLHHHRAPPRERLVRGQHRRLTRRAVGHPARIPGCGRFQGGDLLRCSRRGRSSDENHGGAKERHPGNDVESDSRLRRRPGDSHHTGEITSQTERRYSNRRGRLKRCLRGGAGAPAGAKTATPLPSLNI